MGMEAINNVNNVNFKGNSKTNEVGSEQKTPEQIKDGKKKLALALGALAIAGGAAVAIAAHIKGKTINLSDMTTGKFKQIQDDKFTGKIKGELKNGDKISLKYYDGQLLESTVEGSRNFTKKYSYAKNGVLPIKITTLNKKGEIINVAECSYEPTGKVEAFQDFNRKYINDRGEASVFTLKKEFDSDGTVRYAENERIGLYDSEDNMAPIQKKYPDGTVRRWEGKYDRKLTYEKLPDGTVRRWYSDGNIEYEKLPDGTKKVWDECGVEVEC